MGRNDYCLVYGCDNVRDNQEKNVLNIGDWKNMV